MRFSTCFLACLTAIAAFYLGVTVIYGLYLLVHS